MDCSQTVFQQVLGNWALGLFYVYNFAFWLFWLYIKGRMLSLLKSVMWAWLCGRQRRCSEFTCMCLCIMYKFILNSEMTYCKLQLIYILISGGTCRYKYLSIQHLPLLHLSTPNFTPTGLVVFVTSYAQSHVATTSTEWQFLHALYNLVGGGLKHTAVNMQGLHLSSGTLIVPPGFWVWVWSFCWGRLEGEFGADPTASQFPCDGSLPLPPTPASSLTRSFLISLSRPWYRNVYCGWYICCCITPIPHSWMGFCWSMFGTTSECGVFELLLLLDVGGISLHTPLTRLW